MADVRVIKRGKKFVVLVNYIQVGVEYSSEAIAKNEAEKIRVRGTW